jgi:20S proteasome alpha/beta subunit
VKLPCLPLFNPKRRPPWRYRMTLCVAAACIENRKPRIVIATDWRAETSVASADTQDKLYWIDDNIPVLIAGTVSRAIELKDTYRQFLEERKKKEDAKLEHERTPITRSNLIDVFKIPTVIFKNKLATEHIGLKYGMTYKAFLSAVARKEIPPTIAVRELNDIAKLDFDCCLILMMFVGKEPYILKVHSDGTLESCEHFAAIGSGEDIASSVLFQREQESDDSKSRTIYCVYEAMRLGAIAPGVGEFFTLDILYPQGEKEKTVHGEWLNHKGQKFMQQQFKQRGPKPFARFPRLPDGCLEKFTQ